MGKFIGAALVALSVLVFSVGLSFVIYRPGNPKVYDSKLYKVEARGYTISDADGAGAEAEAEAFDFATALGEADPAAGAKVAKKCLACHTMEKGGANKVGPNLYGILNHPKAAVSGFAYSDALKSKGGSWTYDELFAFLEKPQAFVPGTKMSFAGFKKPNDNAKIIAYLRSLSDNPPALPPVTVKPAAAPEATAEPAAEEAAH